MNIQSIYMYLILIMMHTLADIVLQGELMKYGKGTQFKYLLYHAGTYSLILLIFSFVFLNLTVANTLIFFGINAGSHFIIDAITSKLKYFYSKGNLMNSYSIATMADHTSHLLILLGSFYLLQTSV